MALDITILKKGLAKIQEDIIIKQNELLKTTPPEEPKTALTAQDMEILKQKWADDMADIIDTYVRSAKVVVTIPSGAIVTTGSPSSQTNALGVVATSDDNFIDKAGLR